MMLLVYISSSFVDFWETSPERKLYHLLARIGTYNHHFSALADMYGVNLQKTS